MKKYKLKKDTMNEKTSKELISILFILGIRKKIQTRYSDLLI